MILELKGKIMWKHLEEYLSYWVAINVRLISTVLLFYISKKIEVII